MTTSPINRTVKTRLPTAEGQFQLYHYASYHDGKEHLALVMGDLHEQEDVLVRVHSECFTGDVLGSQRCDCGEQLQQAMQMIATEGRGVVIYLRQEGRGIGLQKKLQAYNLQDQGHDTVDANLLLGHGADERTYEVAVAILQDLGVASLRLLTNNPHKIEALEAAGLPISGRVPLAPTVHAENQSYLATKVERMRHLLQLSSQENRQVIVPPVATPVGLSVDLPSAATGVIQDLQTRAADYYEHHGLPFVTLSYAQSLDGSIAAADGSPLRISGEPAMRFTHMLRAAHDAILIGVGTLLADDPRLTVRLLPGQDPQPIILDSQLRTPLTARCLSNQRQPWIATTARVQSEPRAVAGIVDHGHLNGAKNPSTTSQHADALAKAGVTLLPVAADDFGRVDLTVLLPLLAERGIRSVMVEGGAQVLGRFLALQAAQAAVVTIAPIFVGGLHALSTNFGSNGSLNGQQATTRTQPNFPKLGEPQFLQLGSDLIYYGQFNTSSSLPRPSQKNVTQGNQIP